MLKSISLDERATLVRGAIHLLETGDEYFYVLDVYDTYAVIQLGGGMYQRVPYTMDEGLSITIAPKSEWTRVEKEWVDVRGLDDLVFFGEGVKALGGGKVGGHLVLHGSPEKVDLYGEFFNAETDYDVDPADWGSAKTSVYYQHGYDAVLKRRVLTKGTLVSKDDVGVWIEAQLQMRDEYERAIYELADAGKMSWSSGTAGHLSERQRVGKAVWIKRWPIVEASLTPTPAEPRNIAVPLKSLRSFNIPLSISEAKSTSTPGAKPSETSSDVAGAAATDTGASAVDRKSIPIEVHDMPEQTQTPPAEQPTGLEAKMDALIETMSGVLKHMQEQPGVKGVGYFSDDGGDADKHVKSFGDYLLSIQRGDEKRLKSIYGSTKDIISDSGTQGGYLVPTEYRQELLQIGYEASPLLSNVTRIPITLPAGKMPALDQFFAPTAGGGGTAVAGKVATSKRSEGGSYTETQPEFELINWRVNDAASGYVEVSKEMRSDSPFMIEALLKTLIGIAVSAKKEYYVLQGNGVGEPLGILNSPALVSVSPATNNVFAYADALNMIARFKSVPGGSPMWLHHPGLLEDIGKFEVGTGGAVLVTNLESSPVNQLLLGYPRYQSEHLPQADSSGAAILIDPKAYLLFELGGLYIDFSEHVGFLNGKDTWRFGERLDGQPWMRNVITLSSPGSAYTMSPFVKHND